MYVECLNKNKSSFSSTV